MSFTGDRPIKDGQGGGGEFDGTVEWNNVSNKPQTYPPSEHNHDERYYTKEESEGHVNFVKDLMEQEQGKIAAHENDSLDYLKNKVDNVTVKVEGNELRVMTLDGLTVGTTDINTALEGIEGNIQSQLNDLLNLLESIAGGMKFKDIAETREEIDIWGNKENGDVAIVLTDETKDNGRSMYVYSDDLGMWRYLGTFTLTTKFISLEDTPSGYENGKYLRSTSSGIVYDDVDYQDLKNKPQSTITEIDDSVDKKHKHNNKEELDNITESTNGVFMYKGVEYVRKSDLVIPQKKFLYARRSGDQVLSSDSTCIFNASVRGDIPYDSSTGLFTLEKDRFYRVTVTASMKTEGFVILHVVDREGNRPHANTAIWTDLTRSYREASTGPLEVVFSPSETKEYKVAVSSLSGVSSLRGVYSTLVIQEL